jgi:hypothetical protein
MSENKSENVYIVYSRYYKHGEVDTNIYSKNEFIDKCYEELEKYIEDALTSPCEKDQDQMKETILSCLQPDKSKRDQEEDEKRQISLKDFKDMHKTNLNKLIEIVIKLGHDYVNGQSGWGWFNVIIVKDIIKDFSLNYDGVLKS